MLALSLAACGGGAGTQPDALSSAPTDTPSNSAPTTPPANNIPLLEGEPPQIATVGIPYTFVPSASDPDQDTLTFEVTGLPKWLTFDATTGGISGMPGDADVGQSGDIEISASDGKAEATITFSIRVAVANSAPPPNAAPTLTGTPATVVMATQSYIFMPLGSDADGDTLAYSITNRPQWASFDTKTGTLGGQPAANNVGKYSGIVITVSDGKASTSLPTFQIEVTAAPAAVNSAPVIDSASPATSVQVGTAYSFKPAAHDPDNDTLIWAIQNKPTWASFSNTTGQLSGTPTAAGTFGNIRISVSDGKLTTPLGTFQIVVTSAAPPPNTAPKISGTPVTSIREGQAYSFKPTASDADKDTLSYSITNVPSWATFSIADGSLTGKAKAGTYRSIVISVSDGRTSVALPAFNIAVAADKPPVISGAPATVATVDTAYSFTPSASDGDNDVITFSVTNNLPKWLTFSTTTGKLSGTPAAGDVGTTASISISASDGIITTSLAAFQIKVNAAATQTPPPTLGSATLSWTPPTTNADGTLLQDLAGFRIYYGNSSTNMNQSVDISDKLATSGTVGSLGTGTWYFNVKAYTATGMESTASSVVSKTFN
jgi:hypothetical protein